MTSPSAQDDRQPQPTRPALAAPDPDSTDATPKRSSRHLSFHRDRSTDNLAAVARSPLDDSFENSLGTAGRRALRKPSPGLLARMKLLDLRYKSKSGSAAGQEVGRLPEDQLRELDSLHQRDNSIKIERRGRAWTGQNKAPKLDTQFAEGGLSDRGMEGNGYLGPMVHESDHSSLLSLSDRMGPSDYEGSEADAQENGTPKHNHSDAGKSRDSSVSASRNVVDTRQSPEEARPPPPEANPPPPPPKNAPPPPPPEETSREPTLDPRQMGMFSPEEEPEDLDSYFNPSSLSRAPSIYTLSRVSFTSQIGQLTSIKLPDADSLSAGISKIPTSAAAARALNEAAGQIKVWVAKASEVLSGLDAEDDVEWSAAAGREGLDEVDGAIQIFESLIKVFVVAIEELQTREDIGSLSTKELMRLVEAMESILGDWAWIKRTLQGVKEQVEIAMEWEELWSTVLGEIGLEVEALSRLVFEMEERRHRSVMAESVTDNGLDIESLETIVEETPPNNKPVANNRYSLPTSFAATPAKSQPSTSHEDSSLLALFARMQPLRASLDFIPMRLAQFQMRGQEVFPSACEELENRRLTLENQWMKLERDAESLRRELGEDRWVLVFRNAGNQARKMCASVKRSLAKLEEALDSGEHHFDLPATAKKIESFQAKKMHYGPAIERVLIIIDKGVKDRLTVNGEILRLQADMRRTWAGLEVDMQSMEQRMEELNINDSQHLRDSISTILSSERSVGSSVMDRSTPGSSPASSVVLMSRKEREQEQRLAFRSNRQSSYGRSTPSSYGRSTPASKKRYSSLPVSGATPNPRKSTVSRSSAGERSASAASHRYSMATPTPNRTSRIIPTPTPQSNKPRWNNYSNANGADTGHNFKPLSVTTPSPYRKDPVPSRGLRASASNTNLRQSSGNGRGGGNLLSPPPSALPRPSSTTPSNKRQSVIGVVAPRTPSRQGNSSSRLGMRGQSSLPTPTSTAARRRSGYLEPTAASLSLSTAVGGSGGDDESESSSPIASRKLGPRSVSAMGGRRSSMLPHPPRDTASRAESRATSRAGSRADSRAGGRVSSLENRPRWRP